MKKVILSLFVLFISITAGAQYYAGGGLSLVHNKHYDVTIFQIAPELGYHLTDKWAIGASVSFTHSKDYNAFGFNPYARLTIFEKSIIRLFIDGGPELIKVEDMDMGFAIGLEPGILIKAADFLSFAVKYGFLGYQNEHAGGVSGLNLSSNNLLIGFYYTF